MSLYNGHTRTPYKRAFKDKRGKKNAKTSKKYKK